VDKLFLETDGVCRNDDPAFLVCRGRQNRGYEVRKTLADAGAGLDHEVARAGYGPADHLGHGELLWGALMGRGLKPAATALRP
jgi:hypothetical protein